MLELIWILLILTVAAAYDLKNRRIPNALILIGFIGLLGFQTLDQNWQPFSVFIGLMVGLSLWQMKAIGGGDSKLLVLVSAAFAPAQLIWLYLYISLAGAGQACWWKFLKKETPLPYAVAILVGTAAYITFVPGKL